jgi:SsrA-binding protein
MPKHTGVKPLVQNRKARHDYFIEDTLEAGIALVGAEVKSIRQGSANMKDCYAYVKNGEAYVHGMHISPYKFQSIELDATNPFRDRKLLLHKQQIRKLQTLSQTDGYSLVPLSMYLKDGKVKLELAVAKGKKLYDKRHDIAERDARREMERSMRSREKEG